jgi:hypothetical protein
LSYRRSCLGNSVIREFGLAMGFAPFSLVAGIVSGVTVGLWAATAKLGPMARWVVRGLLIAALTAGLLMLLADL